MFYRPLVLVAASALAASAAAAPIWATANYFTTTRATATVESPFDLVGESQGGSYSGLIPPRDDTYSVNPILPDSAGEAVAASTLSYSTIANALSVQGVASADVVPGDFMIAGSAGAESTLTVQFELPAGGSYRIIDGYFGGTHASSAGMLMGIGPDPIFSFNSINSQPDGESGLLPPGSYTLELTCSANSEFTFFNGLFADASYSFSIEIVPAGSCPGDLNGDGLVDDSDFSIFVVAYDLLDCADPTMPPNCPSDLNADAAVDDADFVIFLSSYNELVCP
ncbi:MAG: hypothetical protein U0573_02560 [Phycisphaerales bacterium]|nr:hypothetical protein [Planctomycetota bacterium]